MKPTLKYLACAALTLAVTIPPVTVQGASASSVAEYAPAVPVNITTPDNVETRIGTLRFEDGAPDAATVDKAFDQLDFGRGVDAFLKGMSATSVHALCEGFEQA
ncbi:MAG: hypothetical protein KDI10_16440, partial [Halioglobus sp.]|nr:hypothetical protein [Halioglobus sp.]